MTISITLVIIIITVIISILAFNDNNLKYKLTFSPYSYLHHNKFWLVFTHGFIHADYLHLAFNMYVLYMFGIYIEAFFLTTSSIGFIFFLSLYLGGMVFATLPSIIKHRDNPNYLSLGASGAVSAIVFSFIIIEPLAPLGLIIIPGLSIPGFIFGLLYLFAENYMIKKGGSNIAHDAHISGAIFGLLFIALYDYRIYINFFESINQYIGLS
jgi:membrane associated rhomboid family serine protease